MSPALALTSSLSPAQLGPGRKQRRREQRSSAGGGDKQSVSQENDEGLVLVTTTDRQTHNPTIYNDLHLRSKYRPESNGIPKVSTRCELCQ